MAATVNVTVATGKELFITNGKSIIKKVATETADIRTDQAAKLVAQGIVALT
jgi:hypothetical protein